MCLCVCVCMYIHSIHNGIFYMCVCIHIYTYTFIMEYYSGIKTNEILSLGTMWMELENIMLSGIAQRKATPI